jgi:extracellular factor (EF) 3-hydroxypalmitic acid methyl ester biosynthesis protein
MPTDTSFQFLTANDREQMLQGARRLTYLRGEVLFQENASQPDLLVLRRGWVRVDRKFKVQVDGEDQERDLAIARFGPDEVMGEIAFLTDQIARGTAVAEEEVEVEILDGGHINAMLAADQGFAARFYHSLAYFLGDRLLKIFPGMQLSEAGVGAAARSQRPRAGQLSERQFPPELVAGVQGFKSAMTTLTAELQKPNVDSKIAQRQVNAHCDALIDLLDRFTRDEALVDIGADDLLTFRNVADLSRGVGGYVLRETFPILMQSATIERAHEKPRGFAEDRDLLEKIEDNQPDGEGRLGPLIDSWFLGRPLCQARRNTLRQMTRYLRERIATASGSGPLRLTSLAAGTAREIFDLTAAASGRLSVTCIDRDADALVTNGDRAKALGFGQHITFIKADLLAIVENRTAVAVGQQDMIYGLGVCDYLTDEQVGKVIEWAHERLAAGGWLVLTNRDATGPDRALTQHILDWPIIYRSAEEFRDLLVSGFGGAPPDVEAEEAGLNLIGRCRKATWPGIT